MSFMFYYNYNDIVMSFDAKVEGNNYNNKAEPVVAQWHKRVTVSDMVLGSVPIGENE